LTKKQRAQLLDPFCSEMSVDFRDKLTNIF